MAREVAGLSFCWGGFFVAKFIVYHLASVHILRNITFEIDEGGLGDGMTFLICLNIVAGALLPGTPGAALLRPPGSPAAPRPKLDPVLASAGLTIEYERIISLGLLGLVPASLAVKVAGVLVLLICCSVLLSKIKLQLKTQFYGKTAPVRPLQPPTTPSRDTSLRVVGSAPTPARRLRVALPWAPSCAACDSRHAVHTAAPQQIHPAKGKRGQIKRCVPDNPAHPEWHAAPIDSEHHRVVPTAAHFHFPIHGAASHRLPGIGPDAHHHRRDGIFPQFLHGHSDGWRDRQVHVQYQEPRGGHTPGISHEEGSALPGKADVNPWGLGAGDPGVGGCGHRPVQPCQLRVQPGLHGLHPHCRLCHVGNGQGCSRQSKN
mmetsp:Transcript_23819/g.59903  ORF Transcript_23819/g.59903 Transcript_23819/m.59903 type:complete len:374 (-) Transcript_23819:1680-2801(-)